MPMYSEVSCGDKPITSAHSGRPTCRVVRIAPKTAAPTPRVKSGFASRFATAQIPPGLVVGVGFITSLGEVSRMTAASTQVMPANQ